MRDFVQVDVFSGTPYGGNPVAVVIDADGVDDEALARFANWTNLSETTFLLPPTPEARAAGADYRVRIFTPDRELPFAGHPTLGSAHAWLEAGGVPHNAAEVVQQCEVGLVRVRRDGGESGDRLAFAAPPLRRGGPISEGDLEEMVRILGINPADVVAAEWVDNGPGWPGLLLASAAAVLAVEPNAALFGAGVIGLIGPHATFSQTVAPATGYAAVVSVDESAGASDADTEPMFEVRAFIGGASPYEDPVTGSLNASLAQWMIGSGRAPRHYIVAQGTRLGRAGRVFIDASDPAAGAPDDVWVGGRSTTCIRGTVLL
ncbi:PhzF family phenazine biosynthesis protein [Subtercola vilae]|nr:PhzF family phenazine biosynthesis protein [Subtercola vilae]